MDGARLQSQGVLSATRKLYSRRLVVLVALFGLGMACAVSFLTLHSLRSSHQMAIDGAETATRNLVQAVTDAVARAVQSVDVLLISTIGLVAENNSADVARLDAELRGRLTFMPHVRQMMVVGADGKVLFDTVGRAGRTINIRPLLQQHAQTPRPLVIGATEFKRFLGDEAGSAHSLIPFSRLVLDAKGRVTAVVVAAVNPLYFKGIFDGISLEGRGQISLWRFDGTLLVGDARPLDFTPNAHAQKALFKDHLNHSEFGTFLSDEDGEGSSIISYRMTLTWPLVISITMPTQAVLAGWRREAAQLGWPVLVLVLVTLGLTIAVVVSLNRRARAEEGLLLSDLVLETMSNGVVICDATQPDLPLVYVNEAFTQITGYGLDEVIGQNPRFLHGGERDQPGMHVVREAIRSGTQAHTVVKNYRKDGGVYWNDLSISPVRDRGGRITHYLGIQRDITEQEVARADLKGAYARIERYSAELERFSFILAHHLQEPTRQISLYTQMIRHALTNHGDNSLDEPLSFLTAAGTRLRELLKDVQFYLAVDRFAVGGSSCAARDVLVREWGKREADLDGAQLQADDLPEVQLAARRLSDLFGVLLDNCIRYRHPDRPLRVQVSAQDLGDGQWLFRLADNGIGIAPEDQIKVFAVFERLHPRDGNSGNGIGLSIARKIVEAVEGRIWIESDGQSGTCLAFTLPQRQQG